MTSLVKRVAGGLTILESVWLLYAYYDAPVASCLPPACPAQPFIPIYTWATLGLAFALILIGALGVWGASFSYPLGGLLSAAALFVTGWTVVVSLGNGYAPATANDAMIGVAFALVALLANVDAMRAKSGLSEQANPMNLPVFG